MLTTLFRELGGELVVQHELVWWKDGNRCSAYMDSFEFQPAPDASQLQVGF